MVVQGRCRVIDREKRRRIKLPNGLSAASADALKGALRTHARDDFPIAGAGGRVFEPPHHVQVQASGRKMSLLCSMGYLRRCRPRGRFRGRLRAATGVDLKGISDSVALCEDSGCDVGSGVGDWGSCVQQ
jgi:hypothetical protein